LKKIFIVAPYFPPSAMPPAQRLRMLVSHFSDFGWYPVIFTVDHIYRGEVPDPWMMELAGDQYDMITVKCMDREKTGRYGVGDLGLRMLPSLYRTLKKEIKKQKPDLVLYPVPPWYTMVIAPSIKRSTGVPYAIDYIDPWIHTSNDRTLKSRISQTIARLLEGRVVRKSNAILAVSDGILRDLVNRNPGIKNTPMKAIPYGVELKDFKSIAINGTVRNDRVVFRYIGSLSDSMLRVVRVLLEAFAELRKEQHIQVEFIGTSYAAGGSAEPRIGKYILELQLEDTVQEMPNRIPYRKAMELTRDSDILLLVGDMTAYYAASKLMGLIASQQPFFAFLQSDSYPAQFLRRFNYKYLVEYTADDGSTPEDRLQAVVATLRQLIAGRTSYDPIPVEAPEFKVNTAWGMTKDFADTFQKINP
jgi:hypothetical protein